MLNSLIALGVTELFLNDFCIFSLLCHCIDIARCPGYQYKMIAMWVRLHQWHWIF